MPSVLLHPSNGSVALVLGPVFHRSDQSEDVGWDLDGQQRSGLLFAGPAPHNGQLAGLPLRAHPHHCTHPSAKTLFGDAPLRSVPHHAWV